MKNLFLAIILTSLYCFVDCLRLQNNQNYSIRFDHVTIGVRDMDRMIEFYTKGFGFTKTFESIVEGKNFSIATGKEGTVVKAVFLTPEDPKDFSLELIHYENPEGKVAPKQEINDYGYINMFGYLVDDIEETYRKLKDLGATFISEPVYFRS